MKKFWFLSLLLCANFSFSSDADDSSNVSTPRTEPLFVRSSACISRTDNHQVILSNKKTPPVSLMLGTVALLTALSCVICFTDEEIKVVKRLEVDCAQPFNQNDCYDSDAGCAYRACVSNAFCLPGNCTKYTQLPDCNLNTEQKMALQNCNRLKVTKFYKNYSQEHPQGYAAQECLKKRGHVWDRYNKICYDKRKACGWSNLCRLHE